MPRAAATSRPSVGSSRNRIHGSLSRPRAMFIFWRWPVDSVLTRCRRWSPRPTASISSSTRAPALLAAQAVELAEHPELLADREDPVARLLPARDHVHDPADALRLGRHVEAEDARAALARQQQRREDLDQRGLAGAVGPQEAEELARRHLEIHAGERDHGLRLHVVDTAEPGHGDRGRQRGSRCARRTWKSLGRCLRGSAAYHPAGDGSCRSRWPPSNWLDHGRGVLSSLNRSTCPTL